MKKRIAYKIVRNRKRELLYHRPILTIEHTENGVAYICNFSSRYTSRQLKTAIEKVRKCFHREFIQNLKRYLTQQS